MAGYKSSLAYSKPSEKDNYNFWAYKQSGCNKKENIEEDNAQNTQTV